MFNKKNKYDDTNLVTRSVHEIAEQEKDNLKVLMKAYFVFILIVFTTKYINEAIVIYFGMNLIKEWTCFIFSIFICHFMHFSSF